MTNSFRFLDWEVYSDAQDLVGEVLHIVRKLPADLRFSLGGQLARSVFSIVLNIAEGSGRSGDREPNRFLDTALGSTYETLAGLDFLRREKYITQEKFKEISGRLESIARQLGGFKRKFRVAGPKVE